MSLPPNVEHRAWWIWPALCDANGSPMEEAEELRKQFHGKNFYNAVEKAKVHFGLERTQLRAELCHPDEIVGLPPASKQKKIDPWRQLGPKKRIPKKRQK